MIQWFDMPAEGLSGGGQFEIKELNVTENGEYETDGEVYNKVTVNVEGGGGSSDFSTAKMTVNAVNHDFSADPLVIVDNGELTSGFSILAPETKTIDIVLYRGVQTAIIATSSELLTLSGNIVYDEADDCYIITGDCSISL